MAGRGYDYAIEGLLMLPQAVLDDASRDRAADAVLGSDAVDVSLALIHRYGADEQPEPFFTLWFLAAQPVPRAFWPDKPEAIGYRLPRDLGVWRRSGYINWGTGLVGHGFHKGGPWGGPFFLVFYGVLIAACLRFADDLLARQPDNPFLLGVVGAASGQIVAFSRGDIAVFSVNIIAAVGAGLILRAGARFFLGTGLVYQSDDEAGQAGAPPPGLAAEGLPHFPVAATRRVRSLGRRPGSPALDGGRPGNPGWGMRPPPPSASAGRNEAVARAGYSGFKLARPGGR